MADRAGAPPRAWQRMLSGRRLDLLDPSPLDIEISDIAHGLARVARWNGQTGGDHAFSVAQHSLLVEDIFLRPHAGRFARCAADRAAARRAGICHRRHDLAVQVGGRRRLQGRASSGCSMPYICASRCLPTPARSCARTSSAPTRSPPISRRRCSPASRPPRRRSSSAVRAAFRADRFDLACKPAKVVQAPFSSGSRKSRDCAPDRIEALRLRRPKSHAKNAHSGNPACRSNPAKTSIT